MTPRAINGVGFAGGKLAIASALLRSSLELYLCYIVRQKGNRDIPHSIDIERLQKLPRWRLGVRSLCRMALAPLGKRFTLEISDLASHERLQRGLCVVIPGIEGRSTINDGIIEGLVAGGYEGAIEVFDWPVKEFVDVKNLLRVRRNVRKAVELATRIRLYRRQFPDSPVSLIGHSGGGGIAILVMRQLRDFQFHSIVLLAAAISSDYPIGEHLNQTEHGIHNFSSLGDLPTVGIGTKLFGTIDRRFTFSCGAIGFRSKFEGTQLIERPWNRSYLRDFNWSGHLGCTNSTFVDNHIVRILNSF